MSLILSGEKTSTWRLFDDKNLQAEDKLEFINKETGEIFALATATKVIERPLGKLKEEDIEGHEKYSSPEEMYRWFSDAYNAEVGPDTPVKIVWFELKNIP
jgi:hypothetical protein